MPSDVNIAQDWADGLASLQKDIGIGDDDYYMTPGYYYNYYWNNARIEILSQFGDYVNAATIDNCRQQMQNQCISASRGGLCSIDAVTIKLTYHNSNNVQYNYFFL